MARAVSVHGPRLGPPRGAKPRAVLPLSEVTTINAFANDQIKDEALPRFARGEVTGAMVLTEPDAGSDLQAVDGRLLAIDDCRVIEIGEARWMRSSGEH